MLFYSLTKPNLELDLIFQLGISGMNRRCHKRLFEKINFKEDFIAKVKLKVYELSKFRYDLINVNLIVNLSA